MPRRCSDLFFSGEYIYVEVRVRPDGTHDVRIITRDLRECKTSYRRNQRGRVEIVSDMDVE